MMKKIALLIIASLFTHFLEAGEGQYNNDRNLEKWCAKDDLEEVKRLIESNVNLTDRSHRWVNTLEIACEKGHLAIVKYLVDDKKADPQKFSSLDGNGFHEACRNGHFEIVQYLAEHANFNIKITSRTGKFSSLHIACINQKIKIIHYLADHGANFESQNIYNNRPYDFLDEKNKHELRIYKNESHDPRKLLLIDLGHKYDKNSTLHVFPNDIINEIRNQSIQLGLSSAQAKIWKPVHKKAHELNGDSCARNEISNLTRIVYLWPEETKEKISKELLQLKM
jgi:hypothetical protein